MALTKLTDNLNTIEQLPDTPNRTSGYTAAQMKEAFDKNAQAIKTYINGTLTEELGTNGASSGTSGAEQIGVQNRTEFGTCTNVHEVLLYLRGLIKDAWSGILGDNDIKTNMLDHTAGIEAVNTAVIRDSAVTNSKLAGGITKDKIDSVNASAIDGEISNDNIADESIPYTKLAGGIRSTQIYDIDGDKLVDSSITNAKLAGEIAGSKLSDKAVTTDKINDLAVTDEKIDSVSASKVTGLATVATSGAYGDLSGTPSLATVATSGSYSDLSNKPTIPTVPSDVSAFTNDSKYASWNDIGSVHFTGTYEDTSKDPFDFYVCTRGNN